MTDNEIITLDINELPVEKALSLFLSGMTKTEACEEIGISTKTLQRYLHDNPEAQIKAMQVKQKEILPYYDKVADAKKAMIEGLVADAMDGGVNLKIGERIALLTKLEDVQRQLEAVAGVGSKQGPENKEANLEAMNYLKNLGPKLKSGKVTITQTQMTVDES